MRDRLSEITENAHGGHGPCEGCSAHESGGSEFVNPGLSDPDGELMFVTDEPRHPTDWNNFDTWHEYNETWTRRFARARGGQFVNRLLSRTELTFDDVWIADSIKCPTTRDPERGIPSAETDDAFAHCRTYLRDELDAINPRGVVTFGKEATIRTLRALGVPGSQARRVRVTKAYGRSDFDTDIPVVISLHWAQRTVAENEWVPVVQDAIADLLMDPATT